VQLASRVNTASTAVRRVAAVITPRAVRQTDTATVVMAGVVLPAISRVLLTCMVLTVHAPAVVSMVLDVTRSTDCVLARRDSSETTANSVMMIIIITITIIVNIIINKLYSSREGHKCARCYQL